MKHTTLCLVLLGTAFLLSQLYAEPEGTAVTPSFEIAFDEREMERYRVDIEQVTPSAGIETGFVIAYGYYIVPPYQIAAKGESIYVNNVRVTPPLGPKPRAVDSAMLQAYKQSTSGRVLSHLTTVARRGVG